MPNIVIKRSVPIPPMIDVNFTPTVDEIADVFLASLVHEQEKFLSRLGRDCSRYAPEALGEQIARTRSERSREWILRVADVIRANSK
jgi:hypothetical protein